MLKRDVRVRLNGWMVSAACLLALPALGQSSASQANPTAAPAAEPPASAADRGLDVNLVYTADGLGNIRGGARRGWVYQGKVELTLAADLEKLAGLDGWSFYANGFNIHNTGRIRRDYVGGLNTIAAIEGVPRTRLSEVWLEKDFAGGLANLRAGQLAADVEFFYSGLSAMFLQSDWATITAVNLPSGGPAYPLSTPGIRLKLNPTPDISLLLAIYNGDPAGPGTGDEQDRNRHGLNFRTRDPALLMAEAQFRAHQSEQDTGLARTVKLGAWSHRGTFEDQRFADDGRVLANPASSGSPALRKGNGGLYAVLEQQLFRPKGGSAESGISLFGRIASARSDRNKVSFFVDGGLIFAGLIDSRPDDKFGVSVIYARFSDAVRAADQDRIAFSGTGFVRDHEANLELTYTAQVNKGWSVQPMLTLVRHPSGDPGRRALVTGVRSLLRY